MEISGFVFIITYHHKMKYWRPHLHQTNKELGARGFNLQGFDTDMVMNYTLAPAGLGNLFTCISFLLWPQVLQKPVGFQFVSLSSERLREEDWKYSKP